MSKSRSSRFGGFIVLACVVMFISLVLVAPASAAKLRSEGKVVVGPSQRIDDDLYASGAEVTIDGTVTGDVVAAAQKVTINGSVGGDVIAMAQVVTVNGTVADDVRGLAAVVQIGPNAYVGGDLVSAAYSIEAQRGSVIHFDVMSAAGQAVFGGLVERHLLGAYGGLQIDGSVSQNVNVQVGSSSDQNQGPPPSMWLPSGVTVPTVAPGLTIGPNADIGGGVTYTSAAKARVASGSHHGPLDRKVPKIEPGQREQTPTVASWAFEQVRRLIALVLIGLLLVWLMPGWMTVLGDKMRTKPAGSFGWGILAFFVFLAAVVGVLMAAIILAILFGAATLGGLVGFVLSLGALAEVVLIIGFALYVSWGAPTAISLMGGRLMLGKSGPEAATKRLVPFLIGVLVLWIITAIPILNVIAGLAILIFGLGAFWLWAVEKMRGRGAEKAPTSESAPVSETEGESSPAS